jgi:DegV family protein with EDD domain
MQSAQTAAKALEGELDVRVVDSRSVTLGLGSMARWAAEAAADGMGTDAIVADVESQAQRQRIWGTLDTLDNLKKGGRIGGAKALVAGLLSIKPAIELHKGVVEEAGKPRTRGKALRWLADRLLEEPAVEKLCVVHGEAPDIDEFLALIAPKYATGEYTVGLIGPVIGAHGGPRVVGVTYQVPA